MRITKRRFEVNIEWKEVINEPAGQFKKTMVGGRKSVRKIRYISVLEGEVKTYLKLPLREGEGGEGQSVYLNYFYY